MLIRAKGNLIDMAEQGQFNIIVHGCNCQNTMGSGIAKELRDRYPGVYEADTLAGKTWQTPVAKLGNFSTYATVGKQGNLFVVVNAYTQLHYLPRGVDHFEYESFYIILKKLEYIVNEGFNIGFPYIGMGLAGGDSKRIIDLLETFAYNVTKKGGNVTLVEFSS